MVSQSSNLLHPPRRRPTRHKEAGPKKAKGGLGLRSDAKLFSQKRVFNYARWVEAEKKKKHYRTQAHIHTHTHTRTERTKVQRFTVAEALKTASPSVEEKVKLQFILIFNFCVFPLLALRWAWGGGPQVQSKPS